MNRDSCKSRVPELVRQSFIIKMVVSVSVSRCYYQAVIYMFKVKYGNSSTASEICSKLTNKKPERHHLVLDRS